jgi:glycosyltransferase involved in cell wall biosynthesis
VTILDLIPLLLPDYRRNLLVRAYTRLVSLTARRAALVLAISGAARDDIVHHLRIAPDAVRVTPLAADDRLSAAVSAAAVQERFGLPPGYVLYLGGFDVRKNLATLFQAFARVVRELPAARLVVAGRLPDVDSVFTPDPRRLAREAGLAEGTVTWLGFIPEADKALLYSGARLFVFPSQYEGFGLPPLEAMACGVPVVAAATSSLPEVIGPGGVLVDPLDVAALAAAITRMLTDADFHRERVMGARIQAGKFSWSQTAAATWAAYQSALQKG